ncbi:MAG: hypothetical protein DWQ47_07980 [Acidobacteria bacterium]|nr:MAG: hypothetical protein DWQ32_16080 [Acidobacteriota bacterium]REJ99148.1 MAG: hypothetical protein DWQ38_13895 [Acidobacteriota bacterium]REK16131.1 MAG: hypothetical protein DWQ43_03790 [Acidobacteriota bacterium]REK43812.1 MAG: hypothetical protein DWQ47_07980 [Acidobacteriota bacterium]
MRVKKYRLSLLALSAILLISSSAAYSQDKPSAAKKDSKQKAAEVYENRQRALSLILFDSKIKSLDDAPMRCLALHQVVRFLAESGPKDLYPYARDAAEGCLDETLRKADEFTDSAIGWHRGQSINLIRKIDKEGADALEEKYPIRGWAKSMARSMELRASDDPTAVAAKVITEIRTGSVPSGLSTFISSLRRKNADLANAVLEAVIVHYEGRLNSLGAEPDLMYISFEFLRATASPGLRERFLLLALNIGRRAIADRSSEGFTRFAVQMLGLSIPLLEKHLPAVLEEAKSIELTLRTTQSEYDRLAQAAFDRIKESDDKLAAIIAEAEAAEDEKLRNLLWRQAAQVANGEGKLRIAVDATLKLDGFSARVFGRLMLVNTIPRKAFRADDIETIDYILEVVEDAGYRAEVCFFVAGQKTKEGPNPYAVTYFKRGLELLERMSNESDSLRSYSRAVDLAIKLDEGDVFAIARDAVASINRLPGPTAEELEKEDGKATYVFGTLSGSANNVMRIFDVISKEDPDQAYTISQGIQRRDLRLMAEISVEKFKKYPLPKEEKN